MFPCIVTLNHVEAGRLSLKPVSHYKFVEVVAEASTIHSMPSIIIDGVPKSRFIPVNVIVYPPYTEPVSGETEVIIGVLSVLY